MIKVLHVVPRWIGGGPERHLLELARHDRDRPEQIERTLLVLDRPISSPLFIQARRVGLRMLNGSDRETVVKAVQEADIVDITVWNHPKLLDWLRQPWPASRVLMSAAVAGDTQPQILFPDLVAYPDGWLLSAPPGYGSQRPVLAHALVRHVPSLANMDRLLGHARRPHHGVRVAYLGSLTPIKLHPDMIDVIARVDARFDLFGDADPHTVERLRTALTRRQLTRRVWIHGHVEDLASAYASTDVFAYPLTPGSSATSEKALQEAMWIGLPPVLLEGTASVGWIEPEVSGLLARDIPAFIVQLTRLIEDPERRRVIGEAARAHAREQFNPTNNAARIHGLVEELLAQPKRERPPLPGAGSPPFGRFLQAVDLDAGALVDLVDAIVDKPFTPQRFHIVHGEGGWLHYAKEYGQAFVADLPQRVRCEVTKP